MASVEKKKLHDRAVRAARLLRNEKSEYGYINDGAGRRYRVGVYFLLAGELQRACEAFDWFYDEFPDDSGEPVFYLYAALAAHRAGELGKARRRLLQASVSNIFILPLLAGEQYPAPDIWYPSNCDYEEYLMEVEEYLSEPTHQEREWIRHELGTAPFKKMRDGYVSAFQALKYEQDLDQRASILSTWQIVQAQQLDTVG